MASFLFSPCIWLLALLQLAPTCCSVLPTLSMPKCWEAERTVIAFPQHETQGFLPPFPPSLSFAALASWSILTTVYQGIRGRESTCIGHCQQASQAFHLLPMEAKNHVARSQRKTLDDRYNIETPFCLTNSHCTIQSNWKHLGIFTLKQKVQLVKMITGQLNVNIQHLSSRKWFLKVTLVMLLSVTLKQEQTYIYIWWEYYT